MRVTLWYKTEYINSYQEKTITIRKDAKDVRLYKLEKDLYELAKEFMEEDLKPKYGYHIEEM